MASRRSNLTTVSIFAVVLGSSLVTRTVVHAAPLGPAAAPDAGAPAPTPGPDASAPAQPPQNAAGNPAPTAPVSDTLTMPLIAATMEPLRPTLSACMRRESGTVVVTMLVRSDGVVQTVSANGPFNAAALGCIEMAIQAAHFAPFRAPPANVTLRLALP